MISGFRREEDGNSAVLSHDEDRTGRRSTSGTNPLAQHIGGIEFRKTENSIGGIEFRKTENSIGGIEFRKTDNSIGRIDFRKTDNSIGGTEFRKTENSLGISQAVQGSGNGFSLMVSNAISRFVPRRSFKTSTQDETNASCARGLF